jgi:hypothetical protein
LAAEDTRMKAGLKTAEDELNLIKNQVQQTLLDIREHILDATNPFSAIDASLTDEDEIEFGDDLMGGGAGAAGADGAGGSGGGYDGDGIESALDDDMLDDEGLEDELLDDDIEPEEEIIEEIPDDGYDEIIDDGAGGGANSGFGGGGGEEEEVFEEEEILDADEDEGFELDEEPAEEEELELEAEAEIEEQAAAATGTQAGGIAAAMVADFDVLTMAGLVRWVAVTTDRLGPNRTEILLDAFEAAGRITPSTRMVLHHLMALTEEDPSENVPVREIVSAMVRMEGVLDTNTGSESSRLLSMLMDVDDDPFDRMAA